ncbi:hypothetical protein GALL_550810 [mine drainage metagenome]|uniref:Uncharacterized protein n=1 Tax=mine drainage metagenome TaxID=410659 RepID=A0A1J5PDS5_9ZZZZ
MSSGAARALLTGAAGACGQLLTLSGSHNCSMRATPVPISTESWLVPVKANCGE